MSIYQPTNTLSELQSAINRAIIKLKVSKESEICRYIPIPTGGHIHHFTFRKKKQEDPKRLLDMIHKYVLDVEGTPVRVTPKKRAPRGSRKILNNLPLSTAQFERLIQMAKLVGDPEIEGLIKVFVNQRSRDPRSLKRELINSIKQDRSDQELWNQWVELTGNETSTSSLAVESHAKLQQVGS